MLGSVSELLTYIDDKQLTPELGGTLQYCHSEWILFRNVCFFCPYCRAYGSCWLLNLVLEFFSSLGKTDFWGS